MVVLERLHQHQGEVGKGRDPGVEREEQPVHGTVLYIQVVCWFAPCLQRALEVANQRPSSIFNLEGGN